MIRFPTMMKPFWRAMSITEPGSTSHPSAFIASDSILFRTASDSPGRLCAAARSRTRWSRSSKNFCLTELMAYPC
ncbi:hypothetical protein WK13_34755 [Burkholderia ubonensis]|nr:hypothetical protein WK13_34755 [Burkholderia ubonensis]